MTLAYFAGRAAGPASPVPEKKPDEAPNSLEDLKEITDDLEEDTTEDSSDITSIVDGLSDALDKLPGPSFIRESDPFQSALQKIAELKLESNTLLAWCAHADEDKAILAIAHAAVRDDIDSEPFRQTLLARLRKDPTPRDAHFILEALGELDGTMIGETFVLLDSDWEKEPYLTILADFLRKRTEKGETLSFGNHLKGLDSWEVTQIQDIVKRLPPELRDSLKAAISPTEASAVDWPETSKFLEEFGTLLKPKKDLLPDGSPLIADDTLLSNRDSLLQRLDREKNPRSVLLCGVKGSGKSALCHALAADLVSRGYHVFVASAAEVQAGQSYIGQVEERVRKLIAALRDHRVVWLAPDFQDFVLAGRHRFSSTSILDMLLPPLRAGEIRLVGEIRDRALEKVSAEAPAIDAALDIIRLPESSKHRTMEMAKEWLDRHPGRSNIRPECNSDALREAAALIDSHSPGEHRPGNLIEFLKRAFERRIELDGPSGNGIAKLTTSHFRETIAAISGLPVAMLDDRIPLDLGALRIRFETSVLSQPEATDALVRRVAMIKAGLTDPSRPPGVFLFAGPTGTGKTELAKALATFLFSSAERMIRFDMSELQGPGAVSRLNGGREVADSLTSQIRRQPFSVILLDEFEKADRTVWDLFLQVFDDGRLTDTDGNLADFRQAILILTSNLGAKAAQGVPLGFNTQTGAYRDEEIRKAIETTFRPEFVNRIDQIVTFRPLDRETMRGILGTQLERLTTRRGFRDRPWQLEFDPSALDFLLTKGFAPELGARPLLRAIERHLLGPLAEAVVRGEIRPDEQLLFLYARDGKLQWDSSLDENADGPALRSTDEELPSHSDQALILGPAGEIGEIEFLERRHHDLCELFDLEAYLETKNDLLKSMSDQDFWHDPSRIQKLSLAEYLDRVENALRITGEQIERLLSGGWSHLSTDSKRQRVSKLAQRLYLLEKSYSELTRKPEARFDALLAIRSDDTDAKGRAFLQFITGMYQGWADKRAMTLEPRELEGFACAWSVSGLGAAEILRHETGRHQFVEGRLGEVAQVEVHVASGISPSPEDFMQSADPLPVVRRYQQLPTPLVIDKVHSWRTGRLDLIEAGHFDLIGR